MIVRLIPFIFVLIWSTGFVGAKFGLPYAEPFTLLMWRLLFVVGLFLILVLTLRRPKIGLFDASIQGLIGISIHGCYLGGVFAAINANTPSGITALVVSLNPIILALLSGIFLNVKISSRDWLGLILGLVGVSIVLFGASKWEGSITVTGISWLILALAGIVTGTLLQKRFAHNVDLVTGSLYQYSAALVLFFILSFSLETREVIWHFNLILTIAWLVLALSLVAVLLLLYMIRHGEAAQVASYFYLVPPLAIFWGWLFFDEQWSVLTLLGSALIIIALVLIRPNSGKNTKT